MATSFAPHPLASPLRPLHTDELRQRWRVVHDAALLVAELAGDFDAAAVLDGATPPGSLGAASGWRRAVLADGLDDTAAILEGGFRALLAARAAGAPTDAAARALWDEFLAARSALLTLAQPAPPLGATPTGPSAVAAGPLHGS